MPRCRALQAFLKADQGKIDEVDTVQNEKILAFVIEPSGSGNPLCQALQIFLEQLAELMRAHE